LIDDLRKPICKGINKLLEKLYQGLDDEDDNDYSVYTGTSGMIIHLFVIRCE